MSQNLPPCTCRGRAFLILSCPAHNPLSSQYYPTVSGSASLYLPSPPVAEPGVIKADQPIVGFRAWNHSVTQRVFRLTPFSPVRYVPDTVRLHSTGVGGSAPNPWNEAVATAKCRHYADALAVAHRSPTRSCECGLYTWKGPGLAAVGPPGAIWGAVLIWGRVIEHGDEGFRSEFAKIICLSSNGHELTEYAARQRGVPMVSADKVAIYASEFGKVF